MYLLNLARTITNYFTQIRFTFSLLLLFETLPQFFELHHIMLHFPTKNVIGNGTISGF